MDDYIKQIGTKEVGLVLMDNEKLPEVQYKYPVDLPFFFLSLPKELVPTLSQKFICHVGNAYIKYRLNNEWTVDWQPQTKLMNKFLLAIHFDKVKHNPQYNPSDQKAFRIINIQVNSYKDVYQKVFEHCHDKVNSCEQ